MRFICAAYALCVVACGGDSKPAQNPDRNAGTDTPAPAAADSAGEGYLVIEVTDGGAIHGVVRYPGPVPRGSTVSVTEDTAACGSSRLVQPVLVDPRGGLANAVVSLVGITRGIAPAATDPTLDQRDCTFTPHVLLTPAGGTVRVLNNDPLTHNVHTAAFDNRSVNRSQPTGLDVIELSFEAPEKVKVKCDLHPWMAAWIVVTDHPYHAVTDEAGTFLIPDIPPGSYTLEVWHETLGAQSRTVTVAAGETQDMTIDLAAVD